MDMIAIYEEYKSEIIYPEYIYHSQALCFKIYL